LSHVCNELVIVFVCIAMFFLAIFIACKFAFVGAWLDFFPYVVIYHV